MHTHALRGAVPKPSPHGDLRLHYYCAFVFCTGSFSAASNVTGGLEDVDRVTAMLHRAGALALWDYATAAPYVHVDMNPVASGTDDQVHHSFLGGGFALQLDVCCGRCCGNQWDRHRFVACGVRVRSWCLNGAWVSWGVGVYIVGNRQGLARNSVIFVMFLCVSPALAGVCGAR